MENKWFLRLSITACCLAFVVIVLGAYVRLSNAGLGCPDWPGCFGQLTAPDEHHEIQQAVNLYPHLEVDPAKAWKEMIHRYFASTLGLLILIMAWLAWRNRKSSQQQVVLPFVLVVLVIFQGLLGMWTVTQLVRPTIVTLHLLTGLLTLSLLFLLCLKQSRLWQQVLATSDCPASVRRLAKAGLLVLVIQLFLGGWTSTNYVALHCPDFPTCQGKWIPETHFDEAFVFFKDPTINYEGGTLPLQAGVTVHFMHRLGALLTFIVLSLLAGLLIIKTRNTITRRLGVLVFAVLCVQVSLGIANVLLILPLPVAVSHNGFAALLLLSLVLINYSLGRCKET